MNPAAVAAIAEAEFYAALIKWSIIGVTSLLLIGVGFGMWLNRRKRGQE